MRESLFYRGQYDLSVPKIILLLLAKLRTGIIAPDLIGQEIHVGLSLDDRDAWLQPAEDVK